MSYTGGSESSAGLTGAPQQTGGTTGFRSRQPVLGWDCESVSEQLNEQQRARRNELITLARYGKITPKDAEAAAKAQGLPPFERQPDLPAFDPMREPRWTIVMAVCWIAWRDIGEVRRNCPGFASKRTHWLWRRWNEVVENGTKFAAREGWFLEIWDEATTVRLGLLEKIAKAEGELPATWQTSIGGAERALWHALADGYLTAEAMTPERQPVDIPAREWSYLKLYEDGKRDVLRYDALVRREPFREVKLKRNDLLRLWPPIPVGAPVAEPEHQPITPAMLEPLESGPASGYVPLSAALQWIACDAGSRLVTLDNTEAWQAAVAKLWPLVCTGEVELIGLRPAAGLTEAIPAHSLGLVRVHPPIRLPIADMLVSAPSHVATWPYLGRDHWDGGYCDVLYVSGRAAPQWTHLQVRKSDVLSRWPKPPTIVKSETQCCQWLAEQMQQSPSTPPKPKMAFRAEASKRFQSLGSRQFDRAWRTAIQQSGAHAWARAGRKARTAKTNDRTTVQVRAAGGARAPKSNHRTD